MAGKAIQINLDGNMLDIDQDAENPISVSYTTEDDDDFQNRGSSISLDVKVPATLNNDKSLNSFHNPNIEDFSQDEYFTSPKNCSIVAGGDEIITGKAIIKSATHTNKPEAYNLNVYGNNGDWLVQMQDMTLWDVVSSATHIFSQAVVEASWDANGMNEDEDYVYAPVRYKKQFDDEVDSNSTTTHDSLYTMIHMRPSLFVYWLLYRGFKSIGYTINSVFFDTAFFRRKTFPWVWGNFLKIDSKLLDILKCKAVTTGEGSYGTNNHGNFNQLITETEKLDYAIPFAINNTYSNGGYDNGNNYEWNGPDGIMKWTYQPQYYSQFGDLIVGFKVHLSGTYSVAYSSWLHIDVYWYKNGVFITGQSILQVSAGWSDNGDTTKWYEEESQQEIQVSAGDIIEAKIGMVGHVGNTIFSSYAGATFFHEWAQVTSGTTVFPGSEGCSFEVLYFKKPIGGIVDLKQYDKFKNFKFLDLLRGEIDTYNLQLGTDSITKTVYFEPSNSYKTDDSSSTVYDGFCKEDYLDWTEKQDISKTSELGLFNDSGREQIFKFKEDNSDGGLNILTNRYNIIPAAAKYLYSNRFKDGKREMENRFFSPVAHYIVSQWKDITGIAPQLIVIIPENISNASADEAESEFLPKLAYYKGLVDRYEYGGWKWQPIPGGTIYTDKDLPYMFAVNYKNGGQNDPILSYTDEKIGNTPADEVIGRGLLKRFFLQRMAIRNYGKLYKTWFNLNNRDILNFLHREKIIINAGQYLLIQIDQYRPSVDDTTACTLWKYFPITQKDFDSCFPSQDTIANQPNTLTNSFDTQYQKLILLTTDI